MIIGILHEGESDFATLEVLSRNILENRLGVTIKNLSFASLCANGPTPPKLSAAAIRFFETPLKKDSKVDFMIFHSDVDGDSTKRTSAITLRDQYQRDKPPVQIALALPEPHMEEWFFAEVDALCAYFEISVEELDRIPGKTPKDKMKSLINAYSEVTLSSNEIYAAISERIDIDKLFNRDQNFQYFTNDLLSTYNAWSQGVGR
jgi:hypothetical protein